MALYSTAEWRSHLRKFLKRREWTYIRWVNEINGCCVQDGHYLQLTEFTLARWLNSVPGTREYRGPKYRDDYIDLAYALMQLSVINQTEAHQWLLSQGLYPLPHEAHIFGQMRLYT